MHSALHILFLPQSLLWKLNFFFFFLQSGYTLLPHAAVLIMWSCSRPTFWFLMFESVTASNPHTSISPSPSSRVPLWSCGFLWSWLVSSKWCSLPAAPLCAFPSWVCPAAPSGGKADTMANQWDYGFFLNFFLWRFNTRLFQWSNILLLDYNVPISVFMQINVVRPIKEVAPSSKTEPPARTSEPVTIYIDPVTRYAEQPRPLQQPPPPPPPVQRLPPQHRSLPPPERRPHRQPHRERSKRQRQETRDGSQQQTPEQQYLLDRGTLERSSFWI